MNWQGGLPVKRMKGDDSRLLGKLIAYVRIAEWNPVAEPDEKHQSLHALVRNGILAVQANFVEQRTIRDFFRKEFGISLEKGIQEVIDQAKEMGGLEGALDPEAVKERLDSMKNADFIPIPAKVAFFADEGELLASDADIYFLGTFQALTHAHLCVNSFPILYQAYYREQEHAAIEEEIGELLRTIEGPAPIREAPSLPSGMTFKDFLLKDLIPKMLYHRGGDKDAYAGAQKAFRDFMEDYGFPDDTLAIIETIDKHPPGAPASLKRLELLVSKIDALQNEEYDRLESIRRELEALG